MDYGWLLEESLNYKMVMRLTENEKRDLMKKKVGKKFGLQEFGGRILKTDNSLIKLRIWKSKYIQELVDNDYYPQKDKMMLRGNIHIIYVLKKELGVFD